MDSRSPAGWLLASVLIVVVFVFSLRYAPPSNPVSNDSGVFLYGGWRMLEGEVPYRDFWEHRPPGIYVVNAVGLALGGGTRWGVWALETAMLGIGVALLAKALHRRFGMAPAAVSSVMLILAFLNKEFFLRGNFSESYAASLGMVILAAALWWPKSKLAWLGAGLLGGGIFLLKPSCIGIPTAVGILLVVKAATGRSRSDVSRLIAYGLAGVAVLGLTAVVMAALGTFEEFWYASFVHNRYYLAEMRPQGGPLRLAWLSLREFEWIGVLNPLLLVWLTALGALIVGLPRRSSVVARRLAVVLLVGIPLDSILIAMPHRFYGHYFLTLFPMIAIGLALWVQLAKEMASAWTAVNHTGWRRGLAGLVCVAALLTFCEYLAPAKHKFLIMEAVRLRPWPENPEVMKALEPLANRKPLMMWGSEMKWNFILRRPCPSRYSSITPLLVCPEPDRAARFGEVLDALKTHPDTVFVDTLNGSINGIRPELPEGFSRKDYEISHNALTPLPEKILDEFRVYIQDHYDAHALLSNGWMIYLPKQAAPVQE